MASCRCASGAGSPFATGLLPYVVKTSASGKFVYVTNRDSNDISVFSMDQTTGLLTEIAGSPFPSDLGARAIALSGNFAFVANRFILGVAAIEEPNLESVLAGDFGKIVFPDKQVLAVYPG